VRVDIDLYYKVEKPAEIRMTMGDHKRRTGMVNVGEGGISYVSDSEVPVLTELDIVFNLVAKGKPDHQVCATGQVRYCYPLPKFERYPVYRIGVEFLKIDPDERHLIAEYAKDAPED
jgi:hypothetical protein